MRTLHLISHTHWDREWYLTFQQFRLKLVHLVDGLLDLLEQDPGYRHFMLDGQTIVLEDYLQMRPEREEDLRRHIQSGRILVGPWYQLPDEFLVSPESTIRNLLEGDRVARRFGPKMMVGYVPDPFGHIGQLPQLLLGFGIDTACVTRGLSTEPLEFWWQSPDGSRVLMSYMRESYGAGASLLGAGVAGFAVQVQSLRDALAPHSASSHLLLMQGMDHMEPQPETTAALAAMHGCLEEDVILHSTLPAYFAALKDSLAGLSIPIISGELRSSRRHALLPGVLSARMWIKQRNWACETLLEHWAEPFSAWAAHLPGARPGSDTLGQPGALLRQAWRLLMQCHPHDSICGCSIDQVHDEMRPRFDQVEQVGEEITRQSLVTLTGAVNTCPPAPGLSSPFVVFNPLGASRPGLVPVVLEGAPPAFEIVDETGASLPYQKAGLGSSELINVEISKREFRDMYGTVSGGIIMGFRIREFNARQEAHLAVVEVRLSEHGEPDWAIWEHGRKSVEALLDLPEITTFRVIARSLEASRLLVAVPALPAFGYRTFWVRAIPTAPSAPLHLNAVTRALMPLATRLAASPRGQAIAARLVPDPSRKGPFKIANEFLSVELAADGTLDLTDLRGGQVYRGLNRFMDGGDRGDEYNYSPPPADQLITSRLVRARVERGPVQQVLALDLELRLPESLSDDRRSRSPRLVTVPVSCRAVLTHGVPRLDFEVEIDNHARDHRLRVHFPAPFPAAEARYDGHFEIVRRPLDLPAFDSSWTEQPMPEKPARAFTEIGDDQAALLVATQGLPEVEVRHLPGGNAEIAITLLRCVGWLSRDDFSERKGHAGPAIATPGAQMTGLWRFAYSVIPASGDLQPAREQAYAFQLPLRAVPAGPHEGPLPCQGSFIQVEPPAFIVTAVKQTADGRGWLVRGYNSSASQIPLVLSTGLPFTRAWKAGLDEQPRQELPPTSPLRLPARPHEIVTILFSP